VVRGLAAVLVAAAWFAVAPALPEIAPGRTAVLVATLTALGFVVLLAVAVVPAADAPVALVPALAGTALIVMVLSVAGVGAAATPFEVLLFACLGVAFALVLDSVALALVLPVFVAAIDLAAVLGGGPGGVMFGFLKPEPGDPLALELPRWGGGPPVARLGVVDVVFLAAFAAYAWRYGLRPGASAAGMLGGLAAAAVLEVVTGSDMPSLAFLAAGWLLPNADRLPGLLRRARGA
jgi:hypothetical protein